MKFVPELIVIVLGSVAPSIAQDKFSPLRGDLVVLPLHQRFEVPSPLGPLISTGTAQDSIPKRIVWRPFDGATLVVQTVATLGIEALILSATASSAKAAGGNWLAQGATYVVGVSLGAAFLPGSIYYAGSWMGGNGTPSGVYLGMAAGIVVTLPQVFAGSESANHIMTVACITTFVGAIVGYHISSSTVYEDGSGKRSLTLQLFQGSDAQQLPRAPQNVSQLNIRCVVVSVQL